MKDYPVDHRGYGPDREIEHYLGFPPGRLRKMRHQANAPAYIKIGASVRTSYAAADRYMAERARSCNPFIPPEQCPGTDGPADHSGT